MEARFMTEVMLSVSGMSCEHCSGRLTKSLEALDGIQRCIANHIDGATSVVFDETKISLEAVKAAIDDLGFEVK